MFLLNENKHVYELKNENYRENVKLYMQNMSVIKWLQIYTLTKKQNHSEMVIIPIYFIPIAH